MSYYSSTAESYCERCDRYFVNENALQNHLDNSSHHNVCDDCDLDFATDTALEQHYVQSLNHAYCQRCERHFTTQAGLSAHLAAVHWYCSQCNKTFESENGLDQHYRQASVHQQRQVMASKNRCSLCKKGFKSANNLLEHMESKAHRDKDILCHFDGCDQAFVKAFALILHLVVESGGCLSRANRERIERFTRQLDKDNLITDPSPRLVTFLGDRYIDETSVTWSANSKAFNGSCFECYVCHREFQTLPSLSQHLASPKHQDEQYICPYISCRVKLYTLSGFCQHVESQHCGVFRFRAVQQAIDSAVNGVRSLLRV